MKTCLTRKRRASAVLHDACDVIYAFPINLKQAPDVEDADLSAKIESASIEKLKIPVLSGIFFFQIFNSLVPSIALRYVYPLSILTQKVRVNMR